MWFIFQYLESVLGYYTYENVFKYTEEKVSTNE